ncbi:hypothetical protein BD410DRAFT_409520 [Rickenella mellea]|uniref:Uncharacterized protein n=1 Tax=Rickenella mellea TaxID=50990 RepID=A0A4Y7QJH2_9AGAM|nr:hypothetical protein BD410DRAFT_409520 [Rickenella mellea]
MSSTAMLEPFDTPMFDYNEDSDIAMGGENWFHPPSRMEEDGHGAQDTSAAVDISIIQEGDLEVEMMAYDETAEYDMADGEAPIPILQLDIDSTTKDYAEPEARPEPVDDSITNDFQHVVPQEQGIESVVNDSVNEDSGQSGAVAIDPITPRNDPTTTDVHDSDSSNAPHQQEEPAIPEAAHTGHVEETYDEQNDHPEGLTEIAQTSELQLPEEKLASETLEAPEAPNTSEISTYPENEAHDDQSSLVAPNRLGAITSSPPVLFSLQLGGEQHEFALFGSPATEPINAAVADGEEEGNPEETIVLLYHRGVFLAL